MSHGTLNFQEAVALLRSKAQVCLLSSLLKPKKERIQSFPENILYIQGDATEDKVLIEAGIERCGTKEQLAMFEKEAVL